MAEQLDFVIIGGGIAGASVGYFLAPFGRIVILEREDQPGYHSTGRSAALFMEGYGTPQVRALTMASRRFLESDAFREQPVLSPRGTLAVAMPGETALLHAQFEMLQGVTPLARLLSAPEALAMVPVLRPERVVGAMTDPTAADMDVHALHQFYLRGLRRAGGRVVCNADVTALAASRDVWEIETRDARYRAPVVLNAAGAWADAVAALAGVAPIGLQPRRRSAFLFAPPPGLATAGWPTVGGLAHDWYFKPDAGMLLGSPANEDPVEPQDVQPEEMDVAVGIERIEQMTTLTIRRPTRTWAGLRSFVPDGDLVGGFDPAAPGFFWVAAQGGYGIQTSAAMGETCAALARGLPVPEHVASFGLTAAQLSPARLRPPVASA
jgi:D-arginine dehydrogenase